MYMMITTLAKRHLCITIRTYESKHGCWLVAATHAGENRRPELRSTVLYWYGNKTNELLVIMLHYKYDNGPQCACRYINYKTLICERMYVRARSELSQGKDTTEQGLGKRDGGR